MEFECIWLEVRKSCIITAQTARINRKFIEVPALSEILEEVVKTNAKHDFCMWEYSRRLTLEEADRIKQAIHFTEKVEDEKSLSLLVDVAYKGSCYTLTLFAIKRSQ